MSTSRHVRLICRLSDLSFRNFSATRVSKAKGYNISSLLSAAKGSSTRTPATTNQQDASHSRISTRKNHKEFQKHAAKSSVIPIPKSIKSRDLARLMGVQFNVVVSAAQRILDIRIKNTDQQLDQDSASLIALELDFTPDSIEENDEYSTVVERDGGSALISRRASPSPSEYAEWPSRAPRVTVMGHVDHGKTSLLDALRNTTVAKSEAGGITQHIGAFVVRLSNDRNITFLDTPGHEAFTSMRARGAQVTDIVVLVVAADDGIMPQTIEAINHSKAANAPVIVAISKCDKPEANPDMVLQELMKHDLVPEKFGGDVQCVSVSAKTGSGLSELEEAILLQSEIMDLRGDPTGKVELSFIESKMSPGKGCTATSLVTRGTLRPGMVVAFADGKGYCRVRTLTDETGGRLEEALPSTPCEISGFWTSQPSAGDLGVQLKDEKSAKEIVRSYESRLKQLKMIQDLAESTQRKEEEGQSLEMKIKIYEAKKSRLANVKHLRDTYGKYIKELYKLEEEIRQLREQRKCQKEAKVSLKELHLVLKADVHGSLEALHHSLMGIKTKLDEKNSLMKESEGKDEREEIRVKIIHQGVGPVTRSDIELLGASPNANATRALVGFNIPPPDKSLSESMRKFHVPVITHNIIYKLLDDVKDLASGMFTPDYVYDTVGEAEVLAVFRISDGKEIVAGCRINDGSFYRNSNSIAELTGKSSNGEIIYSVIRGGQKVFTGPLRTLKHHKVEVPSISSGMECGVSFGSLFKDVQVGDQILCQKKTQTDVVL